MGRIVVLPLPEVGHTLTMLELAHDLRGRGHDVVMAVPPDLSAFVEERGFSTTTIDVDLLPAGYHERVERLDPSTLARARATRGRRTVWKYATGWGRDEVARLAPDALLCDAFCPLHALAAGRLSGVPVFMVSTVFPIAASVQRPPLTTTLSPSSPRLARQIALARETCAAGGYRPAQAFGLHARAHGYPPDQISMLSSLIPRLERFTEISLTPAALDFADGELDNVVRYVPALDLDRQEVISEDLRRFADSDLPLIYCSLGSQSYRYPDAIPLFEATIEALGRHPDWRGVLAVGDKVLDDHRFEALPDNVMLLGHAPQLWLLRRASAFIAHGGMGGFRESVELETPLLVLPQGFDQPGTAARVEYHELGFFVPRENINSHTIEARLESLIDERDVYAERLARARAAMAREREQNDGVLSAIEAAMGATKTSAPVSGREAQIDGVRGWMLVDPQELAGTGQAVAAGLELSLGPGEQPTVGGSRFTLAESIVDALYWPRGTWLVQGEVGGALDFCGPWIAGSRLRVLFAVPASSLLEEFAWWCADRAMAADEGRSPGLVDGFHELWARRLRLQAEGRESGHGELESRTLELVGDRWRPSYHAAALALGAPVELIAGEAVNAAIEALAAAAVDREEFDLAAARCKKELESELLARVAAHE